VALAVMIHLYYLKLREMTVFNDPLWRNAQNQEITLLKTAETLKVHYNLLSDMPTEV
jgi:hypothetical protein